MPRLDLPLCHARHALLQDAQKKELDLRAPVSKQRAKKFNLEEELRVRSAVLWLCRVQARGAWPPTGPCCGLPMLVPPAPALPQRLKGEVDLEHYENKPVPRPAALADGDDD